MSLSQIALKRLIQEFRQMQKSPLPGILAGPVSKDQSFYKWEALIIGPSDSLWEGGVFRLTLDFTRAYPNKPPLVKFVPPLFHPNVEKNGKVCISILHTGIDPTNYERPEERWSPVRSIQSVLLSIQSILSDPNWDSPANVECSALYRSDRPKFMKIINKHILSSLGLISITSGLKAPKAPLKPQNHNTKQSVSTIETEPAGSFPSTSTSTSS